MEDVRILWSGLGGRTGRCALKELNNIKGVEIVAGISREIYGADDVHFLGVGRYCKLYRFKDLNKITKPQPEDFDVLVDFSHESVFEQVLELAVRTHVPLISGTSGLSDRQMASLYVATNHIPVFRGGNFRFKVKKFIDEAVKLAMNATGELTLFENFYEGKSLPSETSKVVRRRIMEATGKTIEVHAEANLPKSQLPCHWAFSTKSTTSGNILVCDTIGFDELAHDVLEIAKVMAKKPIKKGEFYTLDEIWDDLVSWAL